MVTAPEQPVPKPAIVDGPTSFVGLTRLGPNPGISAPGRGKSATEPTETAPGLTAPVAGSDESGPGRGARIAGLDALRGFALAGIVFVNIGPMLGLSPITPDGTTSLVYLWLQDFVQNRFFPIFSLLFGLSLAMMWQGAAQRTAGRPRAGLLRRLAFLGVLGGLHQLLQPGEALLPYAVAGIVLLIPATYLPGASASSRRWTAGLLGVVGGGLLASGTYAGGGLAVIPGLFLLGNALGLQRVPERLAAWRHTSWVAGSLTIVGSSATLLVFAQTTQAERLVSQGISAALGLLMAATYVCAFVCLLTTPVRRALVAVFAPLGRMACTNYVTATLLIVAFRFAFVHEFDPAAGSTRAWQMSMLYCLVLLALQWGWSMLWLRRFAQGPIEYAWRWATWLERPAGTVRHVRHTRLVRHT